MNRTVFTPATSSERRNASAGPRTPLNGDLRLRSPTPSCSNRVPDGAASAHRTRSARHRTRQRRRSRRFAVHPTQSVVKLDGHEPLTTNLLVAACGDPDGAFTTEPTARKLAGSGFGVRIREPHSVHPGNQQRTQARSAGPRTPLNGDLRPPVHRHRRAPSRYPTAAPQITEHDAPATAPVNAGERRFAVRPTAAVVKLDGHDPLTTSCRSSLRRPRRRIHNLRNPQTRRSRFFRSGISRDDDVFDLVHIVLPPVPPVKPSSTFGASVAVAAQRLRAVDPDGDRPVQGFHLDVADGGAQVRDRACRREPVQQVGGGWTTSGRR